MRRIHIVSMAAIVLTLATSVSGAQGRGRGRGRGEPPQSAGGEVKSGRGGPPPKVVSDEEQRRRIDEERRRTVDYQRHLDEQVRAAQQQQARLQEERREAQLRAQREYEAQLERQRAQIRAERAYATEPYISAPHEYRFRVRGVDHLTNQYGVDVLRRAVNYGYQQGYRAGQADHQDRWRASYENSPAYREATYGYTGSYIDQPDYSYYFRQGFQRGYDDGYGNRLQYGSNSNGSLAILAGVLAGILALTTIR
jgi:hypothetical protein